ncbi:hypothetical protein K1W54_04665 [Micromonospora sp. CPCC 205371]|nr:hypothetical protein [Micromonospora sp. CPCC 205371]
MTGWLAVAAFVALGTAGAVVVFAWRRHREDPLTKGRRAIAGFRRDSAWLKKRPFSDQYDGDGWGNDAATGRRP